MSYQPQVAMVAVPQPRKSMSKWWWIGLLISWIVFIIIGGGLIGGWAANTCSSSYSYSYYSSYGCSDDSNGLYYGGIACFAIGAILHLTFWIVFIIWCVRRRRVQPSPITYVNAPIVEGGAADKSYPFAHPPPHPIPSPHPVHQQPSNITTSPAEEACVGKFCGNCGTAVAGQFCTQCGARV